MRTESERAGSSLELRPRAASAGTVYEILVNGVELHELIVSRGAEGMVSSLSPLGWLPSRGDLASTARFLPEGPADFPNGGRAVLVCETCGDFGCGAVTVCIREQGALIVWSDCILQANYSEFGSRELPLRTTRFNARAYREALAKVPG